MKLQSTLNTDSLAHLHYYTTTHRALIETLEHLYYHRSQDIEHCNKDTIPYISRTPLYTCTPNNTDRSGDLKEILETLETLARFDALTLWTLLYTLIAWFFCTLYIFTTLNTGHRWKGRRCTNAVRLDIYIINQHRSYTVDLS